MTRSFLFGLLGASALVAATAALADPPERVGRVGYIEGAVSLQPSQSDDWTQAFVNFPVVEGEGLWTGDDGRVEIQVGGVDASLDNQTDLDVAELSYGEMRLALTQGSVTIHVRGNPEGGVIVATPAGDVRLDGRGFFRVDVAAPDEEGGSSPAEVTVFQGQAEAPGPGGYTPVSAGEAATLYPGYDPQFQAADDTAVDDWAPERFRAERAQASGYRLPDAISGGADLGRYGDYVSSPEFGTVWFPRDVPADWAPYRFGRWVNVAPWGYTWVDDAPWGFAPFHYGRWAQFDGRWGWIPGQPQARPVYAPALVAFVGDEGWGAQIGVGGAVGWVPLGPDELYRPTYGVSEDYLRRANAADVRSDRLASMIARRDLAQDRAEALRYRNATAATVVRGDALARGLRIREARVQVAPDVLARAPAARPVLPPPPRPAAIAQPGNRPPPRLRALRSAVDAPPARPGAAPVISGTRAAPPPRADAPAARLIAPAQRRNPAAQNRQAVTDSTGAPVATPARPVPRPPRPAANPPAAAEATAPTPPRPPVRRPQPPLAPNAAAPSTAPATNETPAEAHARLVAARKARLEAAQKAAAANQPPPPPAPPR
ncbi:MAG TPA: DUF6600 domain-containing protein [Caulobacteraceae bacterium]